MTKPTRMILAVIAMTISLAALLAGCSGGGGGSPQPGTLVDPAPAYKGATTVAVPSATNAEALAMGGFGSTDIAATIRNVAKTAGNTPAATPLPPVLQLAQILKQSIRRMDLPHKASLSRAAAPSVPPAKTVGRPSNYQIPGEYGGTATYSLEVNDVTGNFYGTIVYQDFTTNTVILNGTTQVIGTFDIGLQVLSSLTLSFESLTLHPATRNNGAPGVTLTGSLAWAINASLATETLAMNMVQADQATGKTYWFRNYNLVTSYTGSGNTQTITGRYYDHDYGYLDLATQAPLYTDAGASYPSQGTLVFTGEAGRWVRLHFLASTLQIEADTNGDNSADWQVERPTNTTPPVNLAPTANAGPDQTVVQWTTVHLDGSASSDPNGDPLTYYWSFSSYPGYTPLTNANTATPTFAPSLPGTYVLTLTVYDGSYTSQDTVTVVVTPVAPSNPTFAAQKWQYGTFGTYIGQKGLFTADLDGDGTQEIIASANVSYSDTQWYVLRRTSTNDYEQVWRSPIYGVQIVRIQLADMTGDGKADVVVGLTDGTVVIYDGPTLKELRRLQVAASQVDLGVADLDGDGVLEIATSDGIGVSVYNAATGALKWSVTTGGGTSLAVGNVDADPGMEIVTTTNGGKGYVLNGLTGAVKWAYINSFGAKVTLADLDSDGMQEIIGAAAWYNITIYDADLQSPTWDISTTLDIDAIIAADTDGDSIPEIIYGDHQGGKIHVIDVRTRTEKWTVSYPSYGASGIAVSDVDKDGKKELLWGAGGSYSGPDYLFIADPATGTIKWQSLDFSGLSPLAVGDVDDDGGDEIVMVTNYSSNIYDAGTIFIFNARTHVLKFRQQLGTRDWTAIPHTVRIGDVDGDGHTEFVVTTADLYNGLIQIYDGATCTLKRQSATYSSTSFTALTLGDADGDGNVEIVAAASTYDQGLRLIVFDSVTMQEKWRSTDLRVSGSSLRDVRLADLDKDGHPDIIAATSNRLIVFDGVTHVLKLMAESPAITIEVADVDGDGALEILVGRNDGKIDVYNSETFAIKNTVSTFATTSVDALRLADLDGNGTTEWLVASNGVLSILGGNGLIWRSPYLGANLGRYNSIATKDVDNNGHQDIFIGSDPVLYQFE